ncbi:hypothetical protein EMIHUDRAFT_206021 [Emiliania huxleyi CCMP1516]|uniref:Uncharacterized protein n=2 Tax=Emiliania huxleyi TaxID=2903 RepID=A0A0D3JQQ8_EMIH1|nr:hypothetical protein EMIHUDRAFT_206021 [Emiliania huxleyi CCMP1516]EOD25843.1 hypothetical protein EMIHUDRAFT_206021 [Emiliania huxleyi CCMP1516]|eukprot:XP_005778272.1 hypothetical protein EMIHUDRAFT_206021 [Emiliania huxleyi CCMP1516]
MPDLTAAELSIPAEQHPDPAKPLVIPVDSTVVGSTLRFIPWSVVGNPAFLNLPPPPPGMQPSWVQIPQWVAISALLPFSEPEPAVATHFDRLSVLRLAVLAAAWRRILGALSDLGVFSTVHVDEDAFRRTASRRGGAVDADGLVQRLPSPARTKFNLTKLSHLLLTYIACSQQTLGRATTAGSAPNPGNLYGIQLGHAIAAWLRAKPGQPDLVVAPAAARPEL